MTCACYVVIKKCVIRRCGAGRGGENREIWGDVNTTI